MLRNPSSDRDARRDGQSRERDEPHKGWKIDGLMMSYRSWKKSVMSNIYLVALLISNASGNVESIEAVDTVTHGGCTNMARQVHVSNEPTPAGYELKFTCGKRAALDSAIAEHNCRVVDQKNNNGIVTVKYACDSSSKNKLVGWVKSVF
jgi:hypothetical protein